MRDAPASSPSTGTGTLRPAALLWNAAHGQAEGGSCPDRSELEANMTGLSPKAGRLGPVLALDADHLSERDWAESGKGR
jgi:hypothetical protein